MNQENQILLLRFPRELSHRFKLQKTLPLPVIDSFCPRNVGFCTFDGCYLLLKVIGSDIVPTLDALPLFQNLNTSEFFRLIGNSKQTAIATVEKVSHDVQFRPCQFEKFPRFDGDYCLTQTDSISCQNWLKSEPIKRTPPPPKPSLKGVLSGAFDY
jgi:hypothetical protein